MAFIFDFAWAACSYVLLFRQYLSSELIQIRQMKEKTMKNSSRNILISGGWDSKGEQWAKNFCKIFKQIFLRLELLFTNLLIIERENGRSRFTMWANTLEYIIAHTCIAHNFKRRSKTLSVVRGYFLLGAYTFTTPLVREVNYYHKPLPRPHAWEKTPYRAISV